ncbi:hypothetical protein XO09_04110 [Thermosipho sp. 1223]|nr:hypothetical protein [Thermosipho sp. 1244]OOC46948.1 hypothetical protein XO09_04110 [Thermosipho sp. 1223]
MEIASKVFEDKRLMYFDIIISSFIKNEQNLESKYKKIVLDEILEVCFYQIYLFKDFSFLSSTIYRLTNKQDDAIFKTLVNNLLSYNRGFIEVDENYEYIRRFNELIMVMFTKFKEKIAKNYELQNYSAALVVDFIFNLYLKKEDNFIWEYLTGIWPGNIFKMVLEIIFDNNIEEDEQKVCLKTLFVKKIIYGILLLGGFIIKHCYKNKLCKNEYVDKALRTLVAVLDSIIFESKENHEKMLSLLLEIVNGDDLKTFREFLDSCLERYFFVDSEKMIFGKAYGGFQEFESVKMLKFFLYYMSKSIFPFLQDNRFKTIKEQSLNLAGLVNNLSDLLEEEEIDELKKFFEIVNSNNI